MAIKGGCTPHKRLGGGDRGWDLKKAGVRGRDSLNKVAKMLIFFVVQIVEKEWEVRTENACVLDFCMCTDMERGY